MAIMKLAIPTSLRFIGNQFGVDPCMARVAIHEIYQLLQNVGANSFICLHNPREVVEGFKAMEFPNCNAFLLPNPLSLGEASCCGPKVTASDSGSLHLHPTRVRIVEHEFDKQKRDTYILLKCSQEFNSNKKSM
ncbi:hypothetical protein Y1Q_0019201 [Alligator mississippiensis]|uniref:Uncharacterized protein n=1 Tax=Alligator mississippiensis TaxID=8496 RepID=A0A151MQC0_ALLMI|nr:hypothetical protein Y1Q_0019201 [Alligator mississippiensis]